jgi:hypothetical protein
MKENEVMERNIGYALSVVKENINKEGKLDYENAKLPFEELVELCATMVGNQGKSFEDIAKSPKMGNALNKMIIQGTRFFEQTQQHIDAQKVDTDIQQGIAELIEGLNQLEISEEPTPKKTKKDTTFDSYIIDKAHTQEIASIIRTQVGQKKGKEAVIIIRCAMELNMIERPPFSALKKEFPHIGCRSNYNKYMSQQLYDDEINSIKAYFSSQLQKLE